MMTLTRTSHKSILQTEKPEDILPGLSAYLISEPNQSLRISFAIV